MNYTQSVNDLGVHYSIDSGLSIGAHKIYYLDFQVPSRNYTNRLVLDQMYITSKIPCEGYIEIIPEKYDADVRPISIATRCWDAFNGETRQGVLVESFGTGRYQHVDPGHMWYVKLSLNKPNSGYQTPCLILTYMIENVEGIY